MTWDNIRQGKYSPCHAEFILALWRHQTGTSFALLAICAVNSPVNSEFHSQRSVTRSFDVFFDLRLNKRLSKQSWGWWFEKPLDSLWRHCNGEINMHFLHSQCIVHWAYGASRWHPHSTKSSISVPSISSTRALMSWRRNEPGHQHPWYWLYYHRIVRLPHQKY